MEIQQTLCNPNESLHVISAASPRSRKPERCKQEESFHQCQDKEKVGVHKETETFVVTRKQTLRNMCLS